MHGRKRLQGRDVLLLVGLQYLLGDIEDALAWLIRLGFLLVAPVVGDEGLLEIGGLEAVLVLDLRRAALPVGTLEPVAFSLRLFEHASAGHGGQLLLQRHRLAELI